MIKKTIIGVVICAFAALVSLNVKMSFQDNNNLSDILLANVEALAQGEGATPKCDAGGRGSSSCSISQEYPGGLSSSKSVTCNPGYFACCTKDGWGNLAAFCVMGV